MSHVIEALKQFYAEDSRSKLDQLDALYAENVVFIDPVHHIMGLEQLRAYFELMYSNVENCRFVFDREVVVDNTATLQWTMRYQHPRLAKGAPLQLRGVSLLTIEEGKIFRHEDYYDMGAMLYEHIPLLGSVLRKVKSRLEA